MTNGSQTLVILGSSENIEAEYGSASEMPFTIMTIYNGQVESFEGFNTKAGCLAAKSEYHECTFECMF